MFLYWCLLILPVIRANAPPLGASVINPSWIWGQRVGPEHIDIFKDKNFFRFKNINSKLKHQKDNSHVSSIGDNIDILRTTSNDPKGLSYTSYQPIKPDKTKEEDIQTNIFWSELPVTDEQPFLPFSFLGSRAGPLKTNDVSQVTNLKAKGNPSDSGHKTKSIHAKKIETHPLFKVDNFKSKNKNNFYDDGTTKFRIVKDTFDLTYDKTFNDEGFNSIKSGFEGGFTSLASHLEDNLIHPPQEPSQKKLTELGNLDPDEVYYADDDLLIIKGGGFSNIHEEPSQDIQLTIQENDSRINPTKPSYEPAYGVNGIPSPFDVSPPSPSQEYNGNIPTIVGPPPLSFHNTELFTLSTPGGTAASDYSPYALFLPADVFGSESQRYYYYKHPKQPQSIKHHRKPNPFKQKNSLSNFPHHIYPVRENAGYQYYPQNIVPTFNVIKEFVPNYQMIIEPEPISYYDLGGIPYYHHHQPHQYMQNIPVASSWMVIPDPTPYYSPLEEIYTRVNTKPYLQTNRIDEQFYSYPWYSFADDLDINYSQFRPAALQDDVEIIVVNPPSDYDEVLNSVEGFELSSEEFGYYSPEDFGESYEKCTEDISDFNSVEILSIPTYIGESEFGTADQEKENFAEHTTKPTIQTPLETDAVNKEVLGIPSHWVSLADDTKVNYLQPKPPIDGDAEMFSVVDSSKPLL